ncbi:ADP-ribosyltransferase [Methanimicrococcus hongohii]|uniref:ADP-ribosyltransferase n=1 Tax=Methanimicrococcus hongohii TaxID=3028295 RepID=UPI00292E1A46|nr:ADP-ribosyltransferase [Methanimicrococcus sp. Hf6]
MTIEEKVEIGNYQDVWPYNVQKRDWSIPIPKNWEDKPWCYVINSSCRFPSFYDSLNKLEKEIILKSIAHIDSAIRKSDVSGNRFVYRGISDPSWMKFLDPENDYTEAAFGSFSLRLESALKYTNSMNPVIFQLQLSNKMKALYVDEAEYEILRPRNSVYKIYKISKKYIQISPNQNKETTIYYLREISM